jgi:hypothetical protein
MHSKGKYIGLNQRIPFSVMDSAIEKYFDNSKIDKESVFQHILEYTAGVNRASKASTYVVQILTRQKQFLERIKNAIAACPYATIRINERKAFCLCLICLTYPITYDLLISLSQGFKVQKQINKKFISEKLMSIYGSNRTVDIAIDALLPMIIELSTIKRDKLGIYSIAERNKITNKIIAEAIVYSDIKLSDTKSILIDDINTKPWYSYFDMKNIVISDFTHLLQKRESSIGKGYLTI